MSVNGVNMASVHGVKIQRDLIKNIVKNDDKTTVVFEDGTTVSYGAQKTEDASIYKKDDGFIVFDRLNEASIRGTDKDDKYKIKLSSDLRVDTGDGNDDIEVYAVRAISINSGSGEDQVMIHCIKDGKVFNAESVIPFNSGRVHIFGNNKTTRVNSCSYADNRADGPIGFYPSLKDSIIEGVPKENVNVLYLENVEIRN